MNKLLEFLQSSSGEMSSKRLSFLSTMFCVLVGTFWICNKLIATGHPELAVDLWNSFFIYSAVLGGFVSIEIIQNLIPSRRLKEPKEEIK